DVTRDQAFAILQALQTLLKQSPEGQALLRQFQADPNSTEPALAEWLQKHSMAMPSPLATYVSGGQVEKLINIGTVGVMLLQQAPPLPSAGTISPIWNIPYQNNPFFTGRETV